MLRGEWMAWAYREHGYSMRRIAEATKLQYFSFSKIVKEWEQPTNSIFKT